jgi:succinoglycan biosynthesis protein ExoV
VKYYQYRGKEPNFGDELNTYLLPRLLPGFFDEVADPLFLGVGSLLNIVHPQHVRKIVLGAGYGGAGYGPAPQIDENWTIYSVRGPRTATALGLAPQKVSADLAVMMTLYRTAAPVKRYKASFMPHFASLYFSDWRAIATDAGLHFIDPRRPVEEVLAELEASEVVISEAMHGAIVADALRVPWVAMEPVSPMHRFKWFDWAEALHIRLRPQPMLPGSFYEHWMTRKVFGRSWRRYVRPFRAPLRRLPIPPFASQAAASLVAAAKSEPNLSKLPRLEAAVSRLQDDLVALRRDFPM